MEKIDFLSLVEQFPILAKKFPVLDKTLLKTTILTGKFLLLSCFTFLPKSFPYKKFLISTRHKGGYRNSSGEGRIFGNSLKIP